MHASLVAPQETAPQLMKMSTETVKGDPKARDVEHILDEKMLTIERNDCHSTTQDRGKGIVTHADAKAVNRFLGDEGTTIRDHVISGASVHHNKTEWGAAASGRNSLQQRLKKIGGRTMSSTNWVTEHVGPETTDSTETLQHEGLGEEGA